MMTCYSRHGRNSIGATGGHTTCCLPRYPAPQRALYSHRSISRVEIRPVYRVLTVECYLEVAFKQEWLDTSLLWSHIDRTCIYSKVEKHRADRLQNMSRGIWSEELDEVESNSQASTLECSLESDFGSSGGRHTTHKRLDVCEPHDLITDIGEPQRLQVRPLRHVQQHLQAAIQPMKAKAPLILGYWGAVTF